MSKFDLGDYVEVKERIAEFRKAFPEGSLQADVIPSPDGFIAVKGYAFRTPDDVRPGTGLAWEPFPGKTPYTKDSELQNAETSAWGRAIIAVGAADASKGVASQDEVRNRAGGSSEGRSPSPVEPDPADWLKDQVESLVNWTKEQSREAYKTAMAALAFDTPLSQSQADQVFRHMANTYEQEAPFETE
jgi:hypothetical protein